MDLDETISISAESRNETASDIPGPGRLLGRVYAELGRELEAILSFVARRVGRGPATTARRIQRLALTLNDPDCHIDCPTPSENGEEVRKLKKKLEQNCRLLVKYTKYVSCLIYVACH